MAKTIAYYQKVTVDENGIIIPIHEENGMLLVLEPDASTNPDKFTFARLSSVVDGDLILAMGRQAIISSEPPNFPPLDSRPINNLSGKFETNSIYFEPYKIANRS